MNPTVSYLLRRIGLTLVTIWILVTVVFLMMKLIPGDPAQVAAGQFASPDQVDQVRHRLGLDQPVPYQYLLFLLHLLQGNFGTSTQSSRPVLSDLVQLVPSSLELAFAALAMAVVIALIAAPLAALTRGKSTDTASRLVAVFGAGLPVYWAALMAQLFLCAKLGLFPVDGQLSFGVTVPRITGFVTVDALVSGNFSAFFNAWGHLLLPSFLLALPFMPGMFRALRASLLTLLDEEYISVVRAKGASTMRIMYRHALPNALGPFITLIGIGFGGFVGFAVIVEVVFRRPGIGQYLTAGVTNKDTFAVLGAVIVVGITVCIANFVTDVIRLFIDPRLRGAELAEKP